MHVFNVLVNRQHLENFKLNLWGDNEALVKSFHKCGTSCRFIDALMRIMMIELARFNIDPVGDREKYEHAWCSTKEQIPFGDALSRNDTKLFLDHFKKNFPTIKPTQLTIIGPTFSPPGTRSGSNLDPNVVGTPNLFVEKEKQKIKKQKVKSKRLLRKSNNISNVLPVAHSSVSKKNKK